MKEKAIEEFAFDLCKEFNKNEGDNYYWLSMDSARLIVEGLLAKDYRKESDTAREILGLILAKEFEKGDYLTDNELHELFKEKYGVDLGE